MVRMIYRYSFAWICAGVCLLASGSSGAAGVARLKVHGKRDNGYAVALQSDGKILVAGSAYSGKNLDAFVIRLLPDGRPDPVFGKDGVRIIDYGSDEEIYALEVLKDGRIVAVGTMRSGTENVNEVGGDYDFLIVRLLPSGALDDSFGSHGVVNRGFGFGNDKAYGVVSTALGELFVAGTVFVGTDSDQGLFKLHANGSPDEKFGKNGTVLNSFGIDDDYANGLLLQPDGKLVIYGNSRLGKKNLTTLARFDQLGVLDPTFGQGGKVLTSVRGTQDNSFTAAVQKVPDSRLLVAGSTSNGDDLDLALMRYHPDGNLDLSFAVYGKKILQFGKSLDNTYTMGLQSGGRVVMGGSSFEEGKFNFDSTLIRLTKQGNIDTSFGRNGKVFARVDDAYDAVYALAVQPDEKIVTVGVVGTGDEFQVCVLRFLPNGALDASFATASRSVAGKKK